MNRVNRKKHYRQNTPAVATIRSRKAAIARIETDLQASKNLLAINPDEPDAWKTSIENAIFTLSLRLSEQKHALSDFITSLRPNLAKKVKRYENRR